MPRKKQLIDAYEKLAKKKGKKTGIVEGKREPNADWLLDAIHSLDVHHEIFKKGFIPLHLTPDTKSGNVGGEQHVTDVYGIFENIPTELAAIVKAKRSSGAAISKTEK